VLAYKLAFAPMAMKMIVIVPVPIVFALFVYCCLETKEQVRELGVRGLGLGFGFGGA